MNIDAVKARLDELQRLCEAATKGPVTVALQDEGGDAECWTLSFDAYPGSTTAYAATDDPNGIAALHLFAAARTWLPAFLDYADGLVARYEAAEEAGRRRMGFPAGKRHALRTELAELAALLEVAE